MASRSVTMTFTFHKPWWTRAAFAVAKLALRLGYRLDIDRFSDWLVGHCRITSEVDKD